jgi:hypothetical protein
MFDAKDGVEHGTPALVARKRNTGVLRCAQDDGVMGGGLPEGIQRGFGFVAQNAVFGGLFT